MKFDKYQTFIKDCSERYPEHSDLFEAISKAFATCFEVASPYLEVELADSSEADLLSKVLKIVDSNTDVQKEDLNKIYTKFVQMDRSKFNEPFSEIFHKIKLMVGNLESKTSTPEEILKYINQFI